MIGDFVIEKKAYAKINLALDVLYKRLDGYHEVSMLMQSINLYDTVTLTKQTAGIQLTTNRADLPGDVTNLAYRAAHLLQKTCSRVTGVAITLDKNIPIAAGLAGGSSDAAAVLSGMNELFELGLSLSQLSELGAQIGSDIPFCLSGGTQLATGRGEKLTAVPSLPPCYVILAKPAIAVSTAWVYQNYRFDHAVCHPNVGAFIAALGEGDLVKAVGYGGNVLESVTFAAHPALAKLKERMAGDGFLMSLMSGSGPTIFALTTEKERALQLQQDLENDPTLFVSVVKTVTRENE